MSAVISATEHAPQVATPRKAPSLLARIGERYNVEPGKMLDTLKATAFRVEGEAVTNEQMMGLLIVADQHHLNPFTREIFAFRDGKTGAIVPVVSVDGWSRIINDQPQFDGMEFTESEQRVGGPDGPPAWIECAIYRKDRGRPTKAREYLAECRRNTGPWSSHPRRMLRHRAMMQCARLAFGFSFYDPEDAERMNETVIPSADKTVDAINARLAKRAPPPEPVGDPLPTGKDAIEDAKIVEPKAAAEAKPAADPEEKPEATPAAAKPADPAAPPPLTYAQVADAMSKAATVAALDEAATGIERVASPQQKAELAALYKSHRSELESA